MRPIDLRELAQELRAEADALDQLMLRLESRGDAAAEYVRPLQQRVESLRKLATQVENNA